MKVLLFISILMIVISGCSSGSDSTQTNPQQIAALQTFADNFASQYKSESGLSAVSITAQCSGMNYGQPITVFSGTIGHGVQNQAVIQPNDEWQIGSNSKSFAAIVLIELASDPQYHFSLDDHIQKWITPTLYPQLQNLLRYNPTIRQMMNMTSGIPDDDEVLSELLLYPNTYISPLSLVSFANAESATIPGSNWNYSNTNYNIFNLLVNAVTGNSLQAEINNRIILPLGLHNTYFVSNLPADYVNVSRLVKGYIQVTGKPMHEISTWTLSWAQGSGSIISTTNDINTYYRSLFTTNKVLNANQLTNLSSFVSDKTGDPISSPSQSSDGAAYGLGIGAWDLNIQNEYVSSLLGESFIASENTNLLSHINDYNFIYTYSGSTLGFIFIYFYNPQNNASVVVGYNSYDLGFIQGYALPFSVLNYMDPICH